MSSPSTRQTPELIGMSTAVDCISPEFINTRGCSAREVGGDDDGDPRSCKERPRT